MSASACLRILVDLNDGQFAKLDALGPLVAKVTGAFLETRWAWPKHYSILNPFSFMLTDPKAVEVDVTRLERLAEELQLRLFGTGSDGDITLLLHEGDTADTARFVQMDPASLKAAAQQPLQPTPFGGRLMKISTAPDAGGGLRWRTLAPASAARPSTSEPAVEPSAGAGANYRGVYFMPKEAFVGSGVMANTGGITQYSLVDGAERVPHERAEEFDLSSLEAGLRYLQVKPFVGVMFFPVSFTSLMRRSSREAYQQRFGALQTVSKEQLAAVVYDVPRAPAFQAFAQMYAVISRYFSIIDLQISDAGFAIDSVPEGIVNSVTFRLPEGEERVRLVAIKRFMERRDAFKRREVWPAITNLRTRAELLACLRERTPFITGPAVCGALNWPIGSLMCPKERLPLTG